MVRFAPPRLEEEDEDEQKQQFETDSEEEQDAEPQAKRARSAQARAQAQQKGKSSLRRANRGGESEEEDEAEEEEEDEDDMQLPLRGHTPNVRALQRHERAVAAAASSGRSSQRRHRLSAEERDAEREEEEKYPLAATPAARSALLQKKISAAAESSSVQQQRTSKLQHMAHKLRDEEEEVWLRRAQRERNREDGLLEEDEDVELLEDELTSAEAAAAEAAASAAAVHASTALFAPPPIPAERPQRAVKPTPLATFLKALPRYERPSRASQYLERNPLAPVPDAVAATPAPSTAAVAAAASSRSVLDFHRHSFRAGWSSCGSALFFAAGIDGTRIVRAQVDVLAVDAGSLPTAGPVATISEDDCASFANNNSNDKQAQQYRAAKRRAIQAALETHLAFHSQGAQLQLPQQPSAVQPNGGLRSSARLFGAADSNTSSSSGFGGFGAASSGFGGFSFGGGALAAAPSSSAAAGGSSSASLTPFTRLCDAYLSSLHASVASLSSSSSSSSAVASELQLSLSTVQLLRCLYSKEEAEQRAPRLSRSMEASLRSGTVPGSGADLSVLTAQQDPYALSLGRENAFELGWLQPSVQRSYVGPRLTALQAAEARGLDRGSDGVTGTRLAQVLAHLVGRDLVRATELCIQMGDFRLATLVSQAASVHYTGAAAVDDPSVSAGARPTLESVADDLKRQRQTSWEAREKGMGAFIPADMQLLFRLLSGDVLALAAGTSATESVGGVVGGPSIGWSEALALFYFYATPRALNTTISRAMFNYKQHAFATATNKRAGGTVRKPFPPYSSYVPVGQRRGGRRSDLDEAAAGPASSQRGVLEDDDDEEDEAMGTGSGNSGALVLRSSTARAGASLATAPSAIEQFDLRFGLLDLYAQQQASGGNGGFSGNLASVLSPQTHVPFVLDHHLSWHVHALLQYCESLVGQADARESPLGNPHRAVQFVMNYVHQVELWADDANSNSTAEFEEEDGGDDLWQWAVYVALAAPLPPPIAALFPRERVVKDILMRHITYARNNPFAIPAASLAPPTTWARAAAFGLPPAGSAAGLREPLPTSLPILRSDASGNFFAVSLSAECVPGNGDALAASSRPPLPARMLSTEAFLLSRLQLPVAWLHECKAVRAAHAQEASVACFHYLHAGQVEQAYRVWETDLRDAWILAILARQQQQQQQQQTQQQQQQQQFSSASAPSVAAGANDASSLDSSLLSLLRVFHSSRDSLARWSFSGGLVLSFLEFQRDFAKNIASFTFTPASTEPSSLRDRAQRRQRCREYRDEMRAFVHNIEHSQLLQNASRAGAAPASATTAASPLSSSSAARAAAAEGAADPSLAALAFSRMSGAVRAQLHALQPLVDEMDAEEARHLHAGAAAATADAATQQAVDLSAGELVSSADRLALLTDWKDRFLQHYNA